MKITKLEGAIKFIRSLNFTTFYRQDSDFLILWFIFRSSGTPNVRTSVIGVTLSDPGDNSGLGPFLVNRD